MKIIFNVIILIILSNFFTYSNNIDSLISATKNLHDNELVDAYNNICNLLLESNPKEGLVYAQQAKALSYKNKYYLGLAKAYKNIGNAYYDLNDLEKSSDNFQKAKPYYKHLNLIREIADLNVCLGINSDLGSNYEQALVYYQLAYNQYKGVNYPQGISFVIHNIGVIYQEQEKYNKAAEYYLYELKLNKKSKSKRDIAYTYQQLYSCYKNLNAYKRAKVYGEKFNKLAFEINDSLLIGVSYSNLGNIYEKEGKYKQALENNIKSYNYLKLSNQYVKLCSQLNNISIIYNKLGNYEKAILYGDSAYNLAVKNNYTLNLIKIYKNFKSIYYNKKDYKKTISYQDKLQQLSDSLNSKEYIKNISELQAKFDYDKQQREIDFLNKDKEISSLKITKIKSQQRYLIILIILTIVLLVVVIQRVRYKVKVNRILELKNNRLDVLNKTKDKFFSIIAHDLKNPLSSSNTLIDLIITNFESLSKDDLKNYLIDLNKSSKNLKDLLNNLLVWARSQTNRIEINFEEFNINEIIISSINQLESNLKYKKISLDNKIEDTKVLADKNMLNTVVRNLISNAIKFTHEGGKIELISEITENDFLKVIVKDNGVGIKNEKLKSIFNIDVNVSTKGTNNESGTGLGLILCKEFIEKNKGEIYVESTERKGSQFIFKIPLYKPK